MSVSLSQFSSRCQRSVGLTMHSSVGVSRNSALTYTYRPSQLSLLPSAGWEMSTGQRERKGKVFI